MSIIKIQFDFSYEPRETAKKIEGNVVSTDIFRTSCEIDDEFEKMEVYEEAEASQAYVVVKIWLEQNFINESDETVSKICDTISYVLSSQTLNFQKVRDLISRYSTHCLEEKLAQIIKTFQDIDIKKNIESEFTSLKLCEQPKVVFSPTIHSFFEKANSNKSNLTSQIQQQQIEDHRQSVDVSTLNRVLTRYTHQKIDEILKSSPSYNRSSFTQAGASFVLNLTLAVLPDIFQNIINAIEKKIELLFTQSDVEKKQESLKNVTGFSHIPDQDIMQYALLFSKQLMCCFEAITQTPDMNQNTPLVSHLRSYTNHLIAKMQDSLFSHTLNNIEAIIFDAIPNLSSKSERLIPKNWSSQSKAMSDQLIFLVGNFLDKQKIDFPSYKIQIDTIRPILMALLAKIAPKLFEEALFQMSTLIESIPGHEKESNSKKHPHYVNALKVKEMVQLYIRDYFMGSPDPNTDPLLNLMTQFLVAVLENTGDRIFLSIFDAKPKELTPDFESYILTILGNLEEFLKNYANALKECAKKGLVGEKATDEMILQFLTSNFVTNGKIDRQKEEDVATSILAPYLNELRQKISQSQQTLFDAMSKNLPVFLLGVVNTFFTMQVKMYLIDRIFEMLSNENLHVIHESSNKAFENWHKQHKKLSEGLGKIASSLVSDFQSILKLKDKSTFLKLTPYIVSLFKSKIGEAIALEIYNILREDPPAFTVKLENIKQMFWVTKTDVSTQTVKLVPTLANTWEKTPDEINAQDLKIQKNLKGKLGVALELHKISFFQNTATKLCDGITEELYRLYRSKILELMIKDIVLASLFLHQNSKPK